MTTTHYTFIVTSTLQRSRKAQELQHADSRAHAARITHKRKQADLHDSHYISSSNPHIPSLTNTQHTVYHKSRNGQHQCSQTQIRVFSQPFCSPYPSFGSFRSELCSTFPEADNPQLPPILDYWCNSANPTNDLFAELFNTTNACPSFLPLLSIPSLLSRRLQCLVVPSIKRNRSSSTTSSFSSDSQRTRHESSTRTTETSEMVCGDLDRYRVPRDLGIRHGQPGWVSLPPTRTEGHAG